MRHFPLTGVNVYRVKPFIKSQQIPTGDAMETLFKKRHATEREDLYIWNNYNQRQETKGECDLQPTQGHRGGRLLLDGPYLSCPFPLSGDLRSSAPPLPCQPDGCCVETHPMLPLSSPVCAWSQSLLGPYSLTVPVPVLLHLWTTEHSGLTETIRFTFKWDGGREWGRGRDREREREREPLPWLLSKWNLRSHLFSSAAEQSWHSEWLREKQRSAPTWPASTPPPTPGSQEEGRLTSEMTDDREKQKVETESLLLMHWMNLMHDTTNSNMLALW